MPTARISPIESILLRWITDNLAAAGVSSALIAEPTGKRVRAGFAAPAMPAAPRPAVRSAGHLRTGRRCA